MAEARTEASPFATLNETATYFAVHTNTIHMWIRDGKFPNAFQAGRQWRIPWKDIEAFQQKTTVTNSD